MRTKLMILIAALAITYKANSQIFLHNSTKEPVMVSTAMLFNTKEYKGWVSVGWYKVSPGETKQVNSVSTSGSNDIFYYYAFSTDSGKEFAGDKIMLVSDDSFVIQNCDMEYVKKENPKYKTKNFRKVVMNAKRFETKYTIELTY